jgi:putative endonuclease
MFYTYILESLIHPDRRYIGRTSDLRRRLAEHNAGKCRHTARYTPWKLKLYVAFDNAKLAAHFERYLKSGSGHAFAQRHFWGQ